MGRRHKGTSPANTGWLVNQEVLHGLQWQVSPQMHSHYCSLSHFSTWSTEDQAVGVVVQCEHQATVDQGEHSFRSGALLHVPFAS